VRKEQKREGRRGSEREAKGGGCESERKNEGKKRAMREETEKNSYKLLRMVVSCTDNKRFEICPIELPEDYKHTSKRVCFHLFIYNTKY
jgi:hypothetical protein